MRTFAGDACSIGRCIVLQRCSALFQLACSRLQRTLHRTRRAVITFFPSETIPFNGISVRSITEFKRNNVLSKWSYYNAPFRINLSSLFRQFSWGTNMRGNGIGNRKTWACSIERCRSFEHSTKRSMVVFIEPRLELNYVATQNGMEIRGQWKILLRNRFTLQLIRTFKQSVDSIWQHTFRVIVCSQNFFL